MNGDELLQDLGEKMGIDQEDIDEVIVHGVTDEVCDAVHERAEQLRNFDTEDGEDTGDEQ